MREYSPGASMVDDYAYGCDNCGKMDGRFMLVWRDLKKPKRSHFAICFACLSQLMKKHEKEINEYLEKWGGEIVDIDELG